MASFRERLIVGPCLFLAACGTAADKTETTPVEPSSDVVAAKTPSNIPEELGVFGRVGEEWIKLNFDDGYSVLNRIEVKPNRTSPEDYPNLEASQPIIINKVPVDPLALQWRPNLRFELEGGVSNRSFMYGSSEPLQASVTELKPGVLQISTKEVPKGFHALEIAPSKTVLVNVK